MNQEGRHYPSDLTDQQWEAIKDLIPPARPGGRKRTVDVRRVISAIFYINRTGSAWRYLPKEFPKWQTVYDYFSRWMTAGVRIDKQKGARTLLETNLKPKRWIVERTFAWFNHYRRLARDFERKIICSENMIYLAMIQLLIGKLAPQ